MPIILRPHRVSVETECVVAFQCARNAKILLRVANRMWQAAECGHGHGHGTRDTVQGTMDSRQRTVGNMCKCACVIIETS